ncbi:MAG TPA: hypothetical protein VKT77_01150 [Chthonomonadaceae bacterium]|nr:hypothetical protein [Chthonomonadaceae bacterium]
MPKLRQARTNIRTGTTHGETVTVVLSVVTRWPGDVRVAAEFWTLTGTLLYSSFPT